MKVEVTAQKPMAVAADVVLVPLWQGSKVPRYAQELDRELEGLISRLLELEDFAGKLGEVFPVPYKIPGSRRVVLVGLGEERSADTEQLRRTASAGVRWVMKRKLVTAALLVPPTRRVSAPDSGQALAEGGILGSYRFDRYRTAEDLPRPPDRLVLLAPDAGARAALQRGVHIGAAVAESTNYTRDVSNEPGSVHTPAWLAASARSMGRELDMRVRVLGRRELEREKMGGILAVGRGSEHPPRLIVVEYEPRARRAPTVALVGKGITFDTGGISLKPAASMPEMKHDLSGGAAVLGTLRAAAILGLPVRLVGIVVAAENKPGSAAYLPGDIVKTASGKTVEVLNTDAEGRIVLADALHYAKRYDPVATIDLATLTGACIVALGSFCSGLMGNNDKLIRAVRTAGERTRERVWPLPLWDEYKEQVKSQIGDLKNTGGREGGTITAGAFLSHFAGDGPWVHLDIAGTAITSKQLPYSVPGATGVGVRLLIDLLRHWQNPT